MRGAATGPDVAVLAKELRKNYGELEAVRGVSFEVAQGEIFGFLGPNGAGKTTTISILATLLKPTSGEARVAGFDVRSEPREVRRRIGLVFQDTTLDDYLTAEENLLFHAELYRVPGDLVRQRLRAVLELVGLWERRKDLVKGYSGGMKRRLEIARGLLHAPRVLFLDEPTLGLDPQTRAHIWEHIRELRRREGVTVFFTTHYMDEAENSDRIAIMDRGEIVAIGTPSELKAGVGRDRVELGTERPEEAAAVLKERFGLEARISDGVVRFHVAGAEEFVPRLFAGLGLPIQSVSISRPTLDDVFLYYTGRTIRDAEASTAELNRAAVRRFVGRRR